MISRARHVLVTGAGGAIGSALARAFARESPNARLTLVDRDAPAIAKVAGAIGNRAIPLPWDLAEIAALEGAYADATKGEPVDVLINCAGFMDMRSFAATPWALGDKLLAVDLVAPLRLMALALPSMHADRYGHVINISSMAGLVPLRGASYYGAAKAGLAMASEIAHLELADRDVHVLTVYPGPVASALESGARAQMPENWLSRAIPIGDAETLAARIVEACHARSPRVVYPKMYEVAERFLGVARRLTAKVSPSPKS